MPPHSPGTGLDALRSRIDQLDATLIAIVAERLAVCREVAELKEGSDTPVLQPARVRDVVINRRQQAIEAGVDPDFVEQLFRVLLTETHRIEVAGEEVRVVVDIYSKTSAIAGWSVVALLRNLVSPIVF